MAALAIVIGFSVPIGLFAVYKAAPIKPPCFLDEHYGIMIHQYKTESGQWRTGGSCVLCHQLYLLPKDERPAAHDAVSEEDRIELQRRKAILGSWGFAKYNC